MWRKTANLDHDMIGNFLGSRISANACMQVKALVGLHPLLCLHLGKFRGAQCEIEIDWLVWVPRGFFSDD